MRAGQVGDTMCYSNWNIAPAATPGPPWGVIPPDSGQRVNNIHVNMMPFSWIFPPHCIPSSIPRWLADTLAVSVLGHWHSALNMRELQFLELVLSFTRFCDMQVLLYPVFSHTDNGLIASLSSAMFPNNPLVSCSVPPHSTPSDQVIQPYCRVCIQAPHFY